MARDESFYLIGTIVDRAAGRIVVYFPESKRHKTMIFMLPCVRGDSIELYCGKDGSCIPLRAFRPVNI
jgi:hypothetical protein